MRRRTIIALVLTILCAVALNRYWLVFRPFQVGFDIKGQGIVNILVLLNKEDNTKFKHVKKAENTINLSESQEFEVIMNHVTSPKRLKLSLCADFDPMGGGAGSLYISGIKLRGGKYRLNDLENFSAENADLIVKDGWLVVTPQSENFSIYYDNPLNIRSAIKFDFKLLIIILILSFLLFYKISNYLADFKREEATSRSDIIFVVLFFILLYIPMQKLDTNTFSFKELRYFAQYQPFIINGEINDNWGTNFSNYFADHFFKRDEIIEVYSKFKYYLAYNNYSIPGHAVIDKQNNWCFRLEDYSLAVFKPLDDEQVKKISDNFKRLNDFCKKNNISLYVVVVPSKEDIYKKYNNYLPQDGIENFNQIYNYLKYKSDVKIIFPSKEFKTIAEKDYLFYKTDYHWTDLGAFVAYQVLGESIKKDFPDFISLQKKDFDIFKNKLVRYDFDRKFNMGQILYAFLNLNDDKIADKVLDVEYSFYKHKNDNLLKIQVNNNFRVKDYYFPSVNNLTAMEIGNSMSENFNEFLPYSFRHLKYFRANNGHRDFLHEFRISEYEQEILKMKPDILILTLSSGHIIPMLNMYESEN